MYKGFYCRKWGYIPCPEGAGETVNSIPRIKEIDVNFNYNTKYDEGEFAQQLADQEAGMNKLTVDEYLKNRERYIA